MGDFIKYLFICFVTFSISYIVAWINDYYIRMSSTEFVIVVGFILFLIRYLLLKLFKFNKDPVVEHINKQEEIVKKEFKPKEDDELEAYY